MDDNNKMGLPLHPIILYKNMGPVTFRKDGYSVTFPTDALNKLYELTLGAEELNVEINAKLLVKNGEVTDVIIPKLDKIIVIDTMLPFVVRANDRSYFDDSGEAVKTLREESYDPSTGRVDVDLAKKNLIKLKDTLLKYSAHLSYKNENGSLEIIYPEVIDSIFSDNKSTVNFVRRLKEYSAYASEWFSSKPLRPFKIVNGRFVYESDGDKRKMDFEADEVIKIHNHPVECPSPPSCWIRDNKIKGDVSEILEGGTYGNLLSRGKGRWELVLFREDNLTNLPKYIKLFSDFWGWTRNRSRVADDIREIALKPMIKEEE